MYLRIDIKWYLKFVREVISYKCEIIKMWIYIRSCKKRKRNSVVLDFHLILALRICTETYLRYQTSVDTFMVFQVQYLFSID